MPCCGCGNGPFASSFLIASSRTTSAIKVVRLGLGKGSSLRIVEAKPYSVPRLFSIRAVCRGIFDGVDGCSVVEIIVDQTALFIDHEACVTCGAERSKPCECVNRVVRSPPHAM